MRIGIAFACLLVSACSASILDRHHFATVDPRTNEVVNIFRVTVKGSADMANARYVSGWFDERAVDLFFNETRSSPLPADLNALAVAPIFRTADCTTLTAEQCDLTRGLRMIPVGSNRANHGAFVMILSTNADAIAGTIGAFAEHDVVMNSALFLANRGEREEAAAVSARSTTVASMRTATMNEIDTLLQRGAASGAEALPDDASREAVYLQALRAAALGLDPDAPTFTTVDQARAWFAARSWRRDR